MFRNAFKVAFRKLMNQKSFSIINILGLSAGMATALEAGLCLQERAFAINLYPSYYAGSFTGCWNCWIPGVEGSIEKPGGNLKIRIR